jgi:hypothetical protein
MILLVGTANEYLIQKAREYSDNPILVTEENWTEEIAVGYTGIEEFSEVTILLQLLHRAKEIYYFPKDNENHSTKSYRTNLEFILLLTNQTIPVFNLPTRLLGNDVVLQKSAKFSKLVDTRKSDANQLWTAGCSYTYGMGVDTKENYPTLLSNMLDLPVSNLAEIGSSIPWAADQILRSDIRKDDIVIWGLTGKERINWWIDDRCSNILICIYDIYKGLEKRFPKRLLLDSDNSLYQALTHIHQVINFCQKVEAKVLIVGLLTSEEDFLYLHNLPEYYHYYNKNSFEMLDYGSDNVHPGPLQHQDYAQVIYEQLQLRNWI